MQGQRKIPTLIGILLIIAIMMGIGFVFESLSKGQTRASSSIEPNKVTVTNVSDTGFTLVWQTEDLTSGTINVTGSNGKKYSGFDERDTTGKLGKYTTHSISVRSLTPQTNYDVTILSNGKRYPIDKKNYQVTTFSTLSATPPTIDPAYGKVVMTDGTAADGAILFLTLQDGQTLSTLVRSSGSWIVPFTAVRTSDGSGYIPISERMSETILVEKAGVSSQVLTDSLNDAPVPDIVLGQTFDFRNRDAKKPTTSTIAKVPATTTKTAVLGAETSTNTIGAISLTSPVDGASVSTTRPQITGFGIAGKKVTITLGSVNPSVGSTTVLSDRSWKYTPVNSLSYGKQSVTITTVDTKGKPIIITHTFTVLKSGTQVLGDATPSAIIETPTPTVDPTATDAATLAAEPMPTSGSLLPTILLLILGSALCIGGGSFLFIK